MQNKVNVYEAINYFTRRSRNSKEGLYQIVISLIGISYSLYKIYKYDRKNRKIENKLNQLSIQQSFTPQEFKSIHENLKTEGIYSEFLYLKNQYDKKNKAHYYRNIYLQGEMMGVKSHNYLGILDLSFDSNEYYFNRLPKHNIRQLDSQGFHKYQFSGCPINISDTIKYECETKFPINLEPNDSMGKWYLANLFLSFLLGQQVWIKGIKIPVTVNAWFEPNQRFVIGCDLVITGGSIRISKVRSIGKTFTSLKYELIKYYKQKMEINDMGIYLSKIGLAVCVISLTYFGIQKMKSYLTQWAYTKEYPRIEEVKTKFKYAKLLVNENQQSKFLICKICQKNLIDLVFIPCYHMQTCQKCLQNQGMIMCLACEKLVYTGIPVFTIT